MKAMKVIYNLKYVSGVASIVASFTDKKKAAQAFEIYSDYIKENSSTEVDWGFFLYRRFKNGDILQVEETRLVTDMNVFKTMF